MNYVGGHWKRNVSLQPAASVAGVRWMRVLVSYMWRQSLHKLEPRHSKSKIHTDVKLSAEVRSLLSCDSRSKRYKIAIFEFAASVATQSQ